MKNLTVALIALLAITACNNSGSKKTDSNKAEPVTANAEPAGLTANASTANAEPAGVTGNSPTASETLAANASVAANASIVKVYYFHGKARCKTCIAVGDVAKETIGKAFVGNNNVSFTEINTSEKEHEALVEKYEVTWNALIIAKGGQSKDLTEQAFATAINNPEKLTEDIKATVNSMLE